MSTVADGLRYVASVLGGSGLRSRLSARSEEDLATGGGREGRTVPSCGVSTIREVFESCGQWQSRFDWEGETLGGIYDFVRDPRMGRLSKHLSLSGKRVLELGCLEGGHSVALSRLGMRELVSVEGRPSNFVKCCVVKTIFRLDNVRFHIDDIRQVTHERYGHFDAAVVMGVLYHLPDPHVLLAHLAELTDEVFLNTHFANEVHPQYSTEAQLETPWGKFEGKRYHEYGLEDPLSGLDDYSFWPYREELIRMFRSAGFASVDVIAEDNTHKTDGAASWIEVLLRKQPKDPGCSA